MIAISQSWHHEFARKKRLEAGAAEREVLCWVVSLIRLPLIDPLLN
jgi:hypothetical protein